MWRPPAMEANMACNSAPVKSRIIAPQGGGINIPFSLTPWQPSSATNGATSAIGDAHDLPRRTHAAFRMVVDRRQAAAGGDCRADAGRRHPLAGGEPAGGDPDRARPVPLLRPPRDVPAAVADRTGRRILHVAEADPPHRAVG